MNKKLDYDILYRGGSELPNQQVLWLTTSQKYASIYGIVSEYKIPLSTLDKLADEKIAMTFVKDKNIDEYPLYESENVDIQKMKELGYTGYYYHEDEYNCLNVCLFKF